MAQNMKRMKLSPCEICEDPETTHMVQCDECDGWYHYHCVGVGPEIKHLDWSCSLCESELDKGKGRHELCKKTSLAVQPKQNYLVSQSKNVDPDTKKQLTDLLKNVNELKIEIGSKNDQINVQSATLETQSKQIEEISTQLLELKMEIESKNGRINEQAAIMDTQQNQIESIHSDVANLKLEIGAKNDRLNAQSVMLEAQRKQIEIISTSLCDLKIEIGTKENRVGASSEVHPRPIKNAEEEVKNAEEEVTVQSNDDWIFGIFLNLQCSVENDLVNFEKGLQNPKLFLGLGVKFCDFGENDVKTFITEMIDRMMTKNLQAQMSWSGKRTTKPGFASYSRIKDLIHFCCKKKFANYDKSKGELIIQKILQNS